MHASPLRRTAARTLGLLALLSAPTLAQTASWTRQFPATFPDLRDVASDGTGTLVAVGDDGQVLRSTDSGVTWNPSTVNPGVAGGRLNAVEAIGTGFLAGGDGLFLSVDGGANWAQIDPTLQIEDIETFGSSHAWAVAAGGDVLRTTDGGATWSSTQLPPGFWVRLESVAFQDTQRGWISTNNGWMYRSNDGGATWVSHQSPTNWTLFGLQRASTISYLLEDSGTWRGNGPNWSYQIFPWVTNARDFQIEGNFGLAVGLSGRIQVTYDAAANWLLSFEDGGWEHWGVVILDPQTAIVVGEAGRVLRTTDGATSWTVVHGQTGTAPTLPWIRGMHALDANTVFAAGTSGIILRSDDAGATWTLQDGGSAQTHYRAVNFFDGQNGYAVGEKQGFYPTLSSTHDGGLNWLEVNQLGMYDIYDVEAIGPNEAVAASDFRIWRTTNGGQSWSSFLPSPSGIYEAIEMEGQTGFAAGTDIIKSTDGGVTWQFIHDPAQRVHGLAFIDDQRGWAVGQNGFILATFDGGATWVPQNSGVTTTLNTVTAISADVVLAAGEQGVVLITADAGASWSPVAPAGLSQDAVRGSAAAGSSVWIGGDAAAGIWKLASGSSSCVVENYCVGKMHSGGGTSYMRLFGVPRVSNGVIGVAAMAAIPNTLGLGFRSVNGPLAQPLWNGTLCVQAPLERMPVLSFDANGFAYYNVQMDPSMVGTSHWYQVFFRDVNHPDGTALAMTDGLKITFCP